MIVVVIHATGVGRIVMNRPIVIERCLHALPVSTATTETGSWRATVVLIPNLANSLYVGGSPFVESAVLMKHACQYLQTVQESGSIQYVGLIINTLPTRQFVGTVYQ